MPKSNADVIVIGGGAIGLFTAWYLTLQGKRVVVLEQGLLGHGSSSQNAGLVAPSHFIPFASPGMLLKGMRWMFNPDSPFYVKLRPDLDLLQWLWIFMRSSTAAHVERSIPALLELNIKSLELYEEFFSLPESFELSTNGLLMLYQSEGGRNDCQKLADKSNSVDVLATMLNSAEVLEKIPEFGPKAKGGLFFPQDGHINPGKLLKSLFSRIQASSSQVLFDTEVIGFEKKNNTISAVKTNQGDFSAPEIVLTGGAWTQSFSKKIGLRIPVQPAKGYSFMVPYSQEKPTIPLLLTEAKVAVTPLEEGIRFAGTLEMTGLDKRINPRRVKAIRNSALAYLKNIKIDESCIREENIWAGFRPLSPDGVPIMSRVPEYSNLTLGVGHSMVGISMASMSGKLISEIVLDKTPSMDMTIFDYKRFM